MPMTAQQRDLFAAAMKSVVLSRFEGSKRGAYTAAGVNSATWARVETGQTVKPHTLSKIVANLFPRTEGDWRLIFNEDGTSILLTYWDMNGLHPSEADTLDRALGMADDPEAIPVEDLPSADRELKRLRRQIAVLELRLERLELLASGPPTDGPSVGLSVVDDNVSDLVAADEQDQSISGEQGESDTP